MASAFNTEVALTMLLALLMFATAMVGINIDQTVR